MAFIVCRTQKAQRFFVLAQTDNLWKEHLQAIKFLQQAVSLRGYAQVRHNCDVFKVFCCLEGHSVLCNVRFEFPWC